MLLRSALSPTLAKENSFYNGITLLMKSNILLNRKSWGSADKSSTCNTKKITPFKIDSFSVEYT